MEPIYPGRSGRRSLWAAQGVLVGLRRCTLDEAFMDIVKTAKGHNVAPLGLADALVAIAENGVMQDFDDDVIAAACRTWGSLLGVRSDDTAAATYSLETIEETETEVNPTYERASY